MTLNDLALGLLVLLGGVLLYASAMGFEPMPGQAYGAGTMPRAIAFVAVGLGAFMIVKSVAAGGARPRAALAAWTRSRPALGGLAVALGAVLFYILASPYLGFVVSAFLVMTSLMLVLGTRPLLAVAVSLLACLVIQQAFGRLLLVPLPRNPFLDFLW